MLAFRIFHIFTKTNLIIYFFDNMRYTTSRFAKFVTELPRKTDAILDRLQTGKFEVDIGSKEVKMLSLEIDRSSNRIAYGIMIGAFVVAGSLMADIGIPIWYGLPAVTLVLYGLAVFSGLTLLASILEEKKLKRGD